MTLIIEFHVNMNTIWQVKSWPRVWLSKLLHLKFMPPHHSRLRVMLCMGILVTYILKLHKFSRITIQSLKFCLVHRHAILLGRTWWIKICILRSCIHVLWASRTFGHDGLLHYTRESAKRLSSVSQALIEMQLEIWALVPGSQHYSMTQ